MFSIIKSHKKAICVTLYILCIPLFLTILPIFIEIIFNIGVYFGSIARNITEGVCCFN